jgi:hypothetical protein
MTSISENQHLAIGKPANAITPATLTAMVGMAKGKGLQIHPSIGAAQAKLASLYLTDPSLGTKANTAAAAMSTISSHASTIFSGGMGSFGSVLGKVKAHVKDAEEIITSQTFISKTNFGDFGDGINNMSSLATQGLESLGDPKSVAATLQSMSGSFDLKDMTKFGQPGAFVEKLQSLRVGNKSNLNATLAKAGVDLNNLSDPTQAAKVNQVLGSITDKKTLTNIADRMGTLKGNNPFAGMKSYTGTDASVNTGASSILGGR